MSNKNKGHHLASTWSKVLTFECATGHIPAFQINTANNSPDHTVSDGGLANGNLSAQIQALKKRGNVRAKIECYRTFVKCAMLEGFAFNPDHRKFITVTNRGKLESAIAEHRAQVNGNPTLRTNLEVLEQSLKHL